MIYLLPLILCIYITSITCFMIHEQHLPKIPYWLAPQSNSMKLSLAKSTQEMIFEELPSSKVIKAISKINSNKVIASDVAAKAGVSLTQAKKDLTKLASLTKGDVAVTNDGELIYSFDSNNIESILGNASQKYKLQQTWNTAIWPKLFYSLRVSFGLLLLLSLFVVFSTLAVVSSGSSSSDDRDDRRSSSGGGGMMSFGFNPFFGPSPFDFFYYRPYYGYYSMESQDDPEEMGFLESTFSYIFGDGNPNQNLEEESLQRIAAFIRSENGAVTAEQLAPFLTDVPEFKQNDSNVVDESFVLPVVTALEGIPQVTDDGDIIYTFDNLQVSATSESNLVAKDSFQLNEARVLKRVGLSPSISTSELKYTMLDANIPNTKQALERRDLIIALDDYVTATTNVKSALTPSTTISTDYLQEREYTFSLASGLNKVIAGGLGLFNLFGAATLGKYIAAYNAAGIQLPSYFGLVQAGYPFLLAYAILFNVIPLMRYFWIQKQNQKVQLRNQNRRLWTNFVKQYKDSKTNSPLRTKIAAAKSFGNKLKKLGTSKNDIIYDTNMDFEDLDRDQENKKLSDFDKLLEN